MYYWECTPPPWVCKDRWPRTGVSKNLSTSISRTRELETLSLSSRETRHSPKLSEVDSQTWDNQMKLYARTYRVYTIIFRHLIQYRFATVRTGGMDEIVVANSQHVLTLESEGVHGCFLGQSPGLTRERG